MFNVVFLSSQDKEKLITLHGKFDTLIDATAVLSRKSEDARLQIDNAELRRRVEDLEKHARTVAEDAERKVRTTTDEANRRVQKLIDEQDRTMVAKQEEHDRATAAMREEFDRREREVLHQVGLEKKRQEAAAEITTKEVEHARREAELSVRETNLAEERKRFEAQMAFVTERFNTMEEYMRDTQGQILSRLPNVNMNINRDDTQAPLTPPRRRNG